MLFRSRYRKVGIEEAVKLTQKKIIPIAKGVKYKVATAIIDELRSLNIKAQMIPRRTSGGLPPVAGKK